MIECAIENKACTCKEYRVLKNQILVYFLEALSRSLPNTSQIAGLDSPLLCLPGEPLPAPFAFTFIPVFPVGEGNGVTCPTAFRSSSASSANELMDCERCKPPRGGLPEFEVIFEVPTGFRATGRSIAASEAPQVRTESGFS